MSRRALILVVLGTLVVATGAAPAAAHPPVVGNEGCTPGFWKNHTEDWQGVSPSDTLGTYLDFPASPAGVAQLADDTLLEALSYKGGPGLAGMARNLLRHAVAAGLNALHEDVAYPLTVEQVVDRTNAALNSGSRLVMEAQKNEFDTFNRLGCPL